MSTPPEEGIVVVVLSEILIDVFAPAFWDVGFILQSILFFVQYDSIGVQKITLKLLRSDIIVKVSCINDGICPRLNNEDKRAHVELRRRICYVADLHVEISCIWHGIAKDPLYDQLVIHKSARGPDG